MSNAGDLWVSGLVLVLATIASADAGALTEVERDALLSQGLSDEPPPPSLRRPWHHVLSIDEPRLPREVLRTVASVQHAVLLRQLGDSLQDPTVACADFHTRLREVVVRAAEFNVALNEAWSAALA
jgi:hypothetical protein